VALVMASGSAICAVTLTVLRVRLNEQRQ